MTSPYSTQNGGYAEIPSHSPDDAAGQPVGAAAPATTAPVPAAAADVLIEEPGAHRRRRSPADRLYERIWLAVLFVALSALAYLFPPNGDDWAWGSQIGIHRLDTFFTDYNGRYVANLVVIALTRLPVLAPIVVGATFTAIVYLVLAITGNRTRWGYAITTALLLAMPHDLWGQVVSWLAGFTNYTLSTLWVLVFLRAVQADWRRGGAARTTPLRAAAIVIGAFLMALFMENVTVFFVIASLVLLVIRRRVLGRVSADAYCWAAGFLLGAVAMFSNGAYRRALTGEAYQQVTGLHGLPTQALDLISRFAVVDNLALNIVLATAIGALALLLARRKGWERAVAPVVLAAGFVVIAVPLALAIGSVPVSVFWRKFGGLSAILLFAGLCVTALAAVGSRQRRWMLTGLLATLILLVGPLLVVNPVGPRCFLVTYVVLLLIVNVLAREVASQAGSLSISGVSVLSSVVVVALLCNYFVVYIPMSIASHDRLAYIRQQVAAGATSVTVQRLPSSEYTHMPDPTPGLWAKRYKLYYDLPSSLTIRLAAPR